MKQATMEYSAFQMQRRSSEGFYMMVHADVFAYDGSRLHNIQVAVSPAGRVVHVFVDHERWSTDER